MLIQNVYNWVLYVFRFQYQIRHSLLIELITESNCPNQLELRLIFWGYIEIDSIALLLKFNIYSQYIRIWQYICLILQALFWVFEYNLNGMYNLNSWLKKPFLLIEVHKKDAIALWRIITALYNYIIPYILKVTFVCYKQFSKGLYLTFWKNLQPLLKTF